MFAELSLFSVDQIHSPDILCFQVIDKTFGLELLESIIKNYTSFIQILRFKNVMSETLFRPIINITLKSDNYSLSLRFLRILYFVVINYYQELKFETESFVSLIINIIKLNKKSNQWKIVLALELLQKLFSEPHFVYYIAQKNFNLFQETLDNICGFDFKDLNDISKNMNEAPLIEDNLTLVSIDLFSLPAESMFPKMKMRIKCIDMLDKKHLPKTNVYYLHFLLVVSLKSLYDSIYSISKKSSDQERSEDVIVTRIFSNVKIIEFENSLDKNLLCSIASKSENFVLNMIKNSFEENLCVFSSICTNLFFWYVTICFECELKEKITASLLFLLKEEHNLKTKIENNNFKSELIILLLLSLCSSFPSEAKYIWKDLFYICEKYYLNCYPENEISIFVDEREEHQENKKAIICEDIRKISRQITHKISSFKYEIVESYVFGICSLNCKVLGLELNCNIIEDKKRYEINTSKELPQSDLEISRKCTLHLHYVSSFFQPSSTKHPKSLYNLIVETFLAIVSHCGNNRDKKHLTFNYNEYLKNILLSNLSFEQKDMDYNSQIEAFSLIPFISFFEISEKEVYKKMLKTDYMYIQKIGYSQKVSVFILSNLYELVQIKGNFIKTPYIWKIIIDILKNETKSLKFKESESGPITPRVSEKELYSEKKNSSDEILTILFMIYKLIIAENFDRIKIFDSICSLITVFENFALCKDMNIALNSLSQILFLSENFMSVKDQKKHEMLPIEVGKVQLMVFQALSKVTIESSDYEIRNGSCQTIFKILFENFFESEFYHSIFCEILLPLFTKYIDAYFELLCVDESKKDKYQNVVRDWEQTMKTLIDGISSIPKQTNIAENDEMVDPNFEKLLSEFTSIIIVSSDISIFVLEALTNMYKTHSTKLENNHNNKTSNRYLLFWMKLGESIFGKNKQSVKRIIKNKNIRDNSDKLEFTIPIVKPSTEMLSKYISLFYLINEKAILDIKPKQLEGILFIIESLIKHEDFVGLYHMIKDKENITSIPLTTLHVKTLELFDKISSIYFKKKQQTEINFITSLNKVHEHFIKKLITEESNIPINKKHPQKVFYQPIVKATNQKILLITRNNKDLTLETSNEIIRFLQVSALM